MHGSAESYDQSLDLWGQVSEPMRILAAFVAVSLVGGLTIATAAVARPELSIPLACDPDRECLLSHRPTHSNVSAMHAACAR